MPFILIFFLVICCIGLLILFGLGGYLISLYNSLVKLKTLVEEAWSGIDVQLKKRYDLIPNLVETVKGYAKQEQDVFTRVTELRSSAMQTDSPKEKAQYEGELTSTLKSLFAVAENYPELKSNQNFLSLQQTLEEIETQLEKARRYYNGTVRNYNIRISEFPANLVAGILGFNQREFFEVENEEERENVKVQF
jgi:LemA protein